jgi:hypothetical protein
MVMLEVALGAWDRAEAARLEIQRDGLVSVTKRSGVQHMNPSIRIEREARETFRQYWKALGLNRQPSPLEELMQGEHK